MSRVLVRALVLALASAAPFVAGAAPPPAGSVIRVSTAERAQPLRGTLVSMRGDSIRLAVGHGRRVAIARAAVTSLEVRAGVRPSTRKATLLGIGGGIVAGAAIGAAAGNVQLGEGEEEGRAPNPQQQTSAAYRAVVGGVVGGLVGGVVGSLTGLGQSEDAWTPVPLHAADVAPRGTLPAGAFAVRVPLVRVAFRR